MIRQDRRSTTLDYSSGRALNRLIIGREMAPCPPGLSVLVRTALLRLSTWLLPDQLSQRRETGRRAISLAGATHHELSVPRPIMSRPSMREGDMTGRVR